MRIQKSDATLHTPPMDETVADALMERAADLAYRAFGEESSDDHIEWAYRRLVMHWRWGLGNGGVVTVH